MLKQTYLILILAFLSSSTFADIVSVNPRPRMQSMGGAGLASVGDMDSAMLNPASLADIETSKMEAFPLTLEAPFELGLLSDFMDYNKVRDSDASTATKRQAFEDFLSSAASMAAATRFNIYPSYTRKYMHVGLLMDFYVDPRLRVGAMPANQVVELGGSSGTVGLIMGGGYGFLDNKLQVGATLKPLYRFALTKEMSQTTLDILEGSDPGNKISDQLMGEDKLGNRAYGVGLDVGVKYYIPLLEETLKPTVGLTYQDIGDTRFVGDTAMPADIPQSISLGVAVHPRYSIFKNTVAIDYRNALKEEDILNKLHLGLESVIWDLVALRVGLSQGYFTGGVGLMLKIFECDVFVTAREAGRYAHIQDIRTVGARLAFAW